jgi:ABC-type branched-subunit amino acid transport system ATPase component
VSPKTREAVRSKAGKDSHDDYVIDVREVSVSYGGVRAVDDVTFGVKRGQILGLIGPNGAGKTTVFDAICGFVATETGRVFVDGHEISGKSPTERARAGLGRSFQDARLFGSLTVSETLSCAFERHLHREDPVSAMFWAPWVSRNEKHIAQRVEEIIGLMGLGAFRDKFISELSTGSRRVVDLACVIAHDPEVLLLDEPSSGMAQKETEAMGPLLLRVKEATGCTMLLIEHDMPLVTSVSDELIALETGRLIVRGTPKEVTNHPRVVEAYLGTDERVVERSGAIRANGRLKRTSPVRTAAAKKAVATRAKAAKRTAAKKKPARKKSASSRSKPKPPA